MFRKFFRILLYFVAYLVLPVGAFCLGYQRVYYYFQEKLVPLPFDAFGWAVGLGCAFLILAIVQLGWIVHKRSSR